MTYRLNKTDGSFLTDLSSDRVDTLTTNLSLIGSNVSYGEYLNENFVKLLENFSSDYQPDRPIVGQVWYSTADGKIKVYSGTSFVEGSGPIVSQTQPANLQQSDIWIDNKENLFYFYDGTDLTLAGPVYKESQKLSGFVVSTVQGTDNISRVIVSLLVGGKLIGIFSKDPVSFEPLVPIAGFEGKIYSGFNPSTLSGLKFDVTFSKTNTLIDAKGREKTADSFMITDGDTSTVGTITIQNADPLILGSASKTSMHVSTDLFHIIANDQNIKFTTTILGAAHTGITILKSGKIGIHTASPMVEFHVQGEASITGDLTVGTVLKHSTSDSMLFTNPDLTLNYGETGEGVTNNRGSTSGIVVDRGPLLPTSIRWNEGTKRWELSTDGVVYETIVASTVLATVALTGDYNDLLDKPTGGQGAWSETPTGVFYEGNVAIGKLPDTNYALDVNGAARISSIYETNSDLGSGEILDLKAGNFFTKTVTGDCYFSTVNAPSDAGIVTSFILTITNGGDHTVGWWRGIKWPSGKNPTLTAQGVDVLAFYTYDGGYTWIGMVVAYDVKLFPTYYIASDNDTYYEGQTIHYTIATADVLPFATFTYTITGVDAGDIIQPLTGTITADESGFATFDVEIAKDIYIEGAETLTLTIDRDSRAVSVLNITSFYITSDKLFIDEGESVTYTIQYSGVPLGVNVPWVLEGVYWWDIGGGVTSGHFVTDASGVAIVNVHTLADERGDGPKNMKLTVGTVTAMVTINDTSRPPPFGTEFPDFFPTEYDPGLNIWQDPYGFSLSWLDDDGVTWYDLGTPMNPDGNNSDAQYIYDNGYIRYTINGYGEGALGDSSVGVGMMYDATGNGDYGSDDYIRPGAPWEGYAVWINDSWYIGGSDQGTWPSGTVYFDIPTYVWKVSEEHFVLMKGNPSIGYLVMHYVTFFGEAIIRIKMQYTNTSNVSVTLKATRGIDPDVDVYAYGTYDTDNQRGYLTIPATDLVYSIGTYSNKPLSLFTNGNGFTHNTAVIGAWPTYNIPDILSGRADSGRSDDAICCAWDCGSLPSGDSAFVTCYYICGSNVEDVVYSIGS